MFEVDDGGSQQSDHGRALDACTLTRWKEELTAALEAPSGLEDSARVDAIRALEELVCVATAGQAALSVELDDSQRRRQRDAGVLASRRARGVGHQVALARRESPHRGRRHLGLARIVASELPHTWTAWRRGHITEWKATLVARETTCLSREDRLAVDAAVCADADRLEAMGDRELAGVVHGVGSSLDPEAFVMRRRRAEADRHVTLRPAPDTMARLSALLPVADGVRLFTALTRQADSARAAGDSRSKGQVMADALVAAVLQAAVAEDTSARWPGHRPASTDPEARARTGTGDRHGAAGRRTMMPSGPISLGLVMTDSALFGSCDEPAHIEGFGPVPAELARELLADSLSREEKVWLRRLYIKPQTGELVSMDARGRYFENSLGRFVRLRDRHCRTPWCDAPIRHGDHVVAHADGGETSIANGQGLCEACDYAKQAPGWHVRPSPRADDRRVEGHEIVTTTPTGHRHRSRPPVVATVRRKPVRIEYVLTG